MVDPTLRFSDRVADYVRYRPGYPPAISDWLVRACGLSPAWVVADIGAGPGNLAHRFLEIGASVIAVEPNQEMREAGGHLLAGNPRYRSVASRAEATGLSDNSIDLVAAGQAFHWFDHAAAKTEFARILKPPGWVVLIWNDRQAAGSPFLEAYERLLLTYATDYRAVRHQDTADTAALQAFFAPAGYSETHFPNQQTFDLAGLSGRLRSSSYAPQPGQPGHDAMFAELAAIFARYQEQGTITFPYETTLFLGQLQPD